MLIVNNIDSYLADQNTSLIQALDKLNQNKHQVLFAVDELLRLKGAFTDGDFRRWVLQAQSIDLTTPLSQVMNRACFYLPEDSEEMLIEEHLSEKIKYIPLVDKSRKIISIARSDSSVITIDGTSISKDSSCYVIAEIGNNHNGCLEQAKKLVDYAIAAGANCVKFQMRDLATLYVNSGNSDDAKEDLGSQYILSLLAKYQLADEEFEQLFAYCRAKKITVLCTPFDTVSADKLERLGVDAYKVASADLTNHELLLHLANKGLPLIVSTGMATDNEIKASVSLLKSRGARFVLLHCNSTYPAPFKDIQLNYLQQLSSLNSGLVGYSGHERGINIAIAAVALGAKVIEKHFTLDRGLEGNDHKVSLLPDEFKDMVDAIRQVELSLGCGNTRRISQGELMNRENLAKSLVAYRDIQQGQLITADMLVVKSPGKGLAPYFKDQLVGTLACRNLVKGDFFYQSDLQGQAITRAKNYSFPHKFGVPVRYHDVALSRHPSMAVVEFHLSFKDMSLNPEDYLTKTKHQQLVVHAPELFENDHTLDLASDDENYRQDSINYLNQVFELARQLKRFYPSTLQVPVVVNVGGFSDVDFIDDTSKVRKYQLVHDAIAQLNLENINMLIQSMPPYPWHFGGQKFHNLFVNPHEISVFCSEYQNVNVCLDVSHSQLACNLFNWNLATFFEILGDNIVHLHIADARGVDDEGLPLGEGELDFTQLVENMVKYTPNATWIPEVWQGHKNNGEGFWQALSYLQSKFEQISSSMFFKKQ